MAYASLPVNIMILKQLRLPRSEPSTNLPPSPPSFRIPAHIDWPSFCNLNKRAAAAASCMSTWRRELRRQPHQRAEQLCTALRYFLCSTCLSSGREMRTAFWDHIPGRNRVPSARALTVGTLAPGPKIRTGIWTQNAALTSESPRSVWARSHYFHALGNEGGICGSGLPQPASH